MKQTMWYTFAIIGYAFCFGWAWLPGSVVYKYKQACKVDFTTFFNVWGSIAVALMIFSVCYSFYRLGTRVYDYIKSSES